MDGVPGGESPALLSDLGVHAMNERLPASAFHFTLRLDPAAGGGEAMFQEVSGIGTEMETEAVPEGGENRFVHALPKGLKHTRLVLRRGVAAIDSGLVKWWRQVLEGGLAQPVLTQQIEVHLVDQSGEALRRWEFTGAYPVKWSVGPFGSMKNEVIVESMELAYDTVRRML
jgi:phage tail-like protein